MVRCSIVILGPGGGLSRCKQTPSQPRVHILADEIWLRRLRGWVREALMMMQMMYHINFDMATPPSGRLRKARPPASRARSGIRHVKRIPDRSIILGSYRDFAGDVEAVASCPNTQGLHSAELVQKCRRDSLNGIWDM